MRFQLLAVCLVLVCGVVLGRGVTKDTEILTKGGRRTPYMSRLKAANLTSNAGDNYIPCKNQLTLMYDMSNDISSTVYAGIQDFVKNQAFANFNHFERLVVGTFGGYIERKILGKFHSLEDVGDFVDGIEQDRSNSDFDFLFEVLDDDLEGDGFPQSVIILVGRFNAKDAQDADRYAEEMHRAGVHISMIGVVPTVEQKQLDKVADFSYVFDITQGIPANIQDIITQANGC